MEIPESQKSSLTPQQKTGFVLLSVFAFLAIGLGLLQMRNTIYNPFVIRPLSGGTNVQAFLDDTTRLQKVDTDKDGLADYDELEFHQTSPYLPDTDSDGISDKDEIENGTDPLCAEGSGCEIVEPPSSPSSIQSPLLENNNPLDLLDTVGDMVKESESQTESGAEGTVDLTEIISDPKTLRQLLLSTGQITEEQLTGVSDEEILGLVNELTSGN